MKTINLHEAFTLTITVLFSQFERSQVIIRKLGFKESDLRQYEKKGMNVVDIDIPVESIEESNLLGLAVNRVM